MAVTVPVVRDQQVQQSGFQARQQIDAPAQAFGSSMAEATQLLGNQMSKTGQMLQERQNALADARNKAKALEAEKQLLSWQTEHLHNPETGVYRKRGAAAMDSTRETLKAYQEMVGKIGSSLESDDQRSLFNNNTLRNQTSLEEQVSKFERDELYNYNRESRKAAIGTYNGAAAASAYNPQVMETYFDRSKELLAEEGLPPDAIDLEVGQQRSKNVLTYMNQQIDQGNTEDAIKYYNSYKGLLFGEDAAVGEAVIGKAVTEVKTNKLADELLAKNPTAAEAIKAGREFEQTEGAAFADALISRIKVKDAERKTVYDQQRSSSVRASWNAIDQGAGPEAIPVWADRATQQSMQKAIQDRASGKDIETDPTTMAKLKKAYLETPGKFATMDINGDINKLSQADRRQVLTWQAESAEGISDEQLKENKKKALSSGQIEAEGRNALRQMYGDKWMGNKKNVAERDKFLYRLDREVELEAERQGKDGLSRDDIKKISDRMLIEGKMQRFGPDKTQRFYELPEDQLEKFYIPYDSIPEGDQITARQAIRENNNRMKVSGQYDRMIPDTREGVERVFNAKRFNRDIYQPGLTE